MRDFDGRLFHLTRVTSLIDILASGWLLPPSWCAEEPQRNGWGANEDFGHHLVCLSLRPSWGLLKRRFPGEESAILCLSFGDVWQTRDVRPCPMNSGKAEAKPFVLGEVSRAAALAACRARPRERWWECEVLVPGPVHISAVREVILSDEQTHERWAELLHSECRRGNWWPPDIRPSRPGGWPAEFPPNHQPTVRTPPRAGRDMRGTLALNHEDILIAATLSPLDDESEQLSDEEQACIWDLLYAAELDPAFDWGVNDGE